MSSNSSKVYPGVLPEDDAGRQFSAPSSYAFSSSRDPPVAATPPSLSSSSTTGRQREDEHNDRKCLPDVKDLTLIEQQEGFDDLKQHLPHPLRPAPRPLIASTPSVLTSDVEYDRQRRIIYERIIPDIDVPRSETELAHFFRAEKMVEVLFDRLPLANTRYEAFPSLDFRSAKNEVGKAYVEIRTTMPCSGLEVIAKKFDFTDFKTVKVIDIINDHSFVGVLEIALPYPFRPRQFVGIAIWRKVDINLASLSRSRRPSCVSAVYQLIAVPTTHPAAPENRTFVKGRAFDLTYLFEVSETETEIVSYLHADPCGNVPKIIVNANIVKYNGEQMLDLLHVFRSRRVRQARSDRRGSTQRENVQHEEASSAEEISTLVTKRRSSLHRQQELIAKIRRDVLADNDKFQRQQKIAKEKILPNIGVFPSSAHLSHFSEAAKIVALFDNHALQCTKRAEYPKLEFRFAYDAESSIGFLEIATTIRCTAIDVIAKRFDYEDFSSAKVIETIHENLSFIGFTELLSPTLAFLPRQFVFIVIWRAVDINSSSLARSRHPESVTAIYQCILVPVAHPSVPETSASVRGRTYEVTFLIEHSSTFEVEYVSYLHTDPGGFVPYFIINQQIIKNNGLRVSEIRNEMQGRRILEEADELDGVEWGGAFMHAKRTAPGRTDLEDVVIRANAALSQITARHPAIKTIVAAVLENKLGRVAVCKTTLNSLTQQEGKKIGAALAASLLSATSPGAGVAEWIGFYPALLELKENYVWFETMMVTIATELLQDSRWGVILRLTISLILSLTDIVTDVVMIVKYFQNEERFFAHASIACLSISMVLQIVISIIQNPKASRRRLVLEVALQLTFVKPIRDTYNVCAGKKHEPGQMLSPLTELTYAKGVELIGESIPGSIIQTYAYITQEKNKRSAIALVSLSVSIATTAFMAVSMTYDIDNDPHRRKNQPYFYGMIRDSSSWRVAAFLSMYVQSFAQILGRTVACALLAASSGTVMASMLIGDFVFFVVFKLIRRDFTFWVPIEGEALSFFAACIYRLTNKLLADVTGFLQVRHPFDMGGLYFSVNTLLSLGFPYVAIQIYSNLIDDDNDLSLSSRLSEAELRRAMILLTLVWAASAISLAASIKREYWRTFNSTETGLLYTVRSFREAPNDERRFDAVFTVHPSFVAPIKNEIKAWVQERYNIWQMERPPWFNDAAVAIIPDEMLPKETLRELLSKGGGKREKSSVRERLNARRTSGLAELPMLERSSFGERSFVGGISVSSGRSTRSEGG